MHRRTERGCPPPPHFVKDFSKRVHFSQFPPLLSFEFYDRSVCTSVASHTNWSTIRFWYIRIILFNKSLMIPALAHKWELIRTMPIIPFHFLLALPISLDVQLMTHVWLITGPVWIGEGRVVGPSPHISPRPGPASFPIAPCPECSSICHAWDFPIFFCRLLGKKLIGMSNFKK